MVAMVTVSATGKLGDGMEVVVVSRAFTAKRAVKAAADALEAFAARFGESLESPRLPAEHRPAGIDQDPEAIRCGEALAFGWRDVKNKAKTLVFFGAEFELADGSTKPACDGQCFRPPGACPFAPRCWATLEGEE